MEDGRAAKVFVSAKKNGEFIFEDAELSSQDLTSSKILADVLREKLEENQNNGPRMR